MENMERMATMASVSRNTVYHTLLAIHKITGRPNYTVSYPSHLKYVATLPWKT